MPWLAWLLRMPWGWMRRHQRLILRTPTRALRRPLPRPMPTMPVPMLPAILPVGRLLVMKVAVTAVVMAAVVMAAAGVALVNGAAAP